jgi:protein O-mannosyl-transferase
MKRSLGASLSYLQKIGSCLLVLLLVLSVVAVYERVRTFGFVDFEDARYIRDNSPVASGLNPESARWAFSLDSSRGTGTGYHPLAWISHMADIRPFGMKPGSQHLVNLALHLGNTVLLFLLLWKMTGAYWKSLLAAAMFGLHPVNVEAVAWLAQRKILLGTLFWLLAMLSHRFYARKPGLSRYMLTLLVFVCGLLSAPMVATLPLVLLLVDYWPLHRFRAGEESSGPVKQGFPQRGTGHLVLEKAPFLFLALLSVCFSLSALGNQADGPAGSVITMDVRIAQGAESLAFYLIKLAMPLNLAVFHPYPETMPFLQALGSLVLIAGLAGIAFSLRRKHPFFLTGLLWYLVTLIPFLGIVQYGYWPAYAERWAYVPFMGIFIILAWGLPLLIEKMGGSKPLFVIIPTIILSFWAGLAWIQTGYWKDSLILFSRALDATGDNFLMENCLGDVYKEIGLLDLAELHCKKSARLDPLYPEAYSSLGSIYAMEGRKGEAMAHISKALALKPKNAPLYLTIGQTLASMQEMDKALSCFARAAEISPDDPQAHYLMGMAYAQMGRANEALASFQKAIRINPGYAEAYCGLAETLGGLGRHEEAMQSYRDALKGNPDPGFAKMVLKKLSAAKKKAGGG